MEFRNKATGEIFEAMQVPIKKKNEAAKDLEQRYAKICGWIIDQKNVVDVDFSVVEESITIYRPEGFHPASFKVWPGLWIKQNNRVGWSILNDEAIHQMNEEV